MIYDRGTPGYAIVDSQVFPFLSEIVPVNRILPAILGIKSLLPCDSRHPFFSLHTTLEDQGTSLVRWRVLSNATPLRIDWRIGERRNVVETRSESFHTTSINESWPLLEIDSNSTNGNLL